MLCFSFEAQEGPLSLSGGRDFPSKLTFHLRYEARKEASPLEVKECFCYDVLCFVVSVVLMLVLVLLLHMAPGWRMLSISRHTGVKIYSINI